MATHSTAWWRDFFTSKHMTEYHANKWSTDDTLADVREIVALLDLKAGDVVLDVPCGSGRISLELARRGLTTTGIDISSQLVRGAESRSKDERLRCTWILGDMQAMSFHGEYDAALCWKGSFGYFDDEGDMRFLRAVHGALRHGGRFALQTPFILELFVARRLEVEGLSVEKPRIDDPDALGVQVDRRYDFETSRVVSQWRFMPDAGTSALQSSIRLYTIRELQRMLSAAGFCSISLMSDATGRPVTFRSKKVYALCVK